MAETILYTTRWCPYCIRARRLLDQQGIGYREIPVDGDLRLREEMVERSGRHTVPQIWIGEVHVGGYTDLLAIHHSGGLTQLLAPADEFNQYRGNQ